MIEVPQDLWVFASLVSVMAMNKVVNLRMKNLFVYAKMVLKVKIVIKSLAVLVSLYRKGTNNKS